MKSKNVEFDPIDLNYLSNYWPHHRMITVDSELVNLSNARFLRPIVEKNNARTEEFIKEVVSQTIDFMTDSISLIDKRIKPKK
ncbi:MAG: hypothetical protein DCO95_13550 [Roseivirga sp. XM-24bin3]|nr:MAG: hypothetical protein DCO95_13550 [Roseivirga sp. XM-24bin3]